MTSFRASTPTDALQPIDSAPAAVTGSSRGRSFFRRPLTVVAAGLVVILTAGGAVAASAAHKTVEIDVDGETTTVSTFAGSVGGALAQAGVDAGLAADVTPGLDAALADGDEIVVRSATPLLVSIDGKTQTVWTTAGTAIDALAELAAAGRDATAVASRSAGAGRQSLDLPVTSSGSVVVLVDGQALSVAVDGSQGVSEILGLAGVVLGDFDRVVLGAGSDGVPTLSVTRVTPDQRLETVVVPFETQEQTDADLYEGERRVVQEGVDGALERAVKVVVVDGAEVYASAPVDTVTVEPVAEIVAVGTKKRPSTTTATPSAAGGSMASVSGVWAALAQCESGGNPTAVSANGLYYGLYQFSISTWQSVGGTGLPSQASPAEQTQRAQTLQARAGWGQWPHCAAKLGLL